MRRFNPRVLTDRDLVLLTIEDIVDSSPMFMADFRDSFALVHKKTGRFIGADHFGYLRLGMDPKLVDGIWRLTEDVDTQKKYEDIQIRPEDLHLGRI
jgi:hypothetical protein